MKKLLLATALAFAPLAALQAAPADVTAAVSAPGRPADAIALDAARHPAEVLRFMGLRQGDRALDLFTGSGYYGEIMARAVGPRGSVLARRFMTNLADTTPKAAPATVSDSQCASCSTRRYAVPTPSP